MLLFLLHFFFYCLFYIFSVLLCFIFVSVFFFLLFFFFSFLFYFSLIFILFKGPENIEKEGYRFHTVFKITEILNTLVHFGKVSTDLQKYEKAKKEKETEKRRFFLFFFFGLFSSFFFLVSKESNRKEGIEGKRTEKKVTKRKKRQFPFCFSVIFYLFSEIFFSRNVLDFISGAQVVIEKTKEKTFKQRSEICKNPVGKRIFEVMEEKKTNLCLAADVLTQVD